MYIDCTAYINDAYTLILDPLKGALLYSTTIHL